MVLLLEQVRRKPALANDIRSGSRWTGANDDGVPSRWSGRRSRRSVFELFVDLTAPVPEEEEEDELAEVEIFFFFVVVVLISNRKALASIRARVRTRGVSPIPTRVGGEGRRSSARFRRHSSASLDDGPRKREMMRRHHWVSR